MDSSIDGLILNGLHNNQTLAQIATSVADATGVELCLYSLGLQPLLLIADGSVLHNFERVFSQVYKKNCSLHSSFSVINIDEESYVISTVYKDGNQIGMLIIHPLGNQMDSSALRFLSSRLSKLCGMLLVPDSTSSPYYSVESLFASNLLLNLDTDSHLVADNPLISKLNGNYAVCAFHNSHQDLIKLKAAERDVEFFFHRSLHVIKDERILVFFHHLGAASLPDWIAEQLKSFCSQYGLQCGVSSCFKELEDKNHYILEAISCLGRASAEAEVVCADKKYCSLFFEQIAEGWEADTFSLYKLQQIADYDYANGTEYFSTLRAYFFAHNCITQAANSLYIDHSTLIYRLKKISSIFEIDLTDSVLLNTLRIGINFQNNRPVFHSISYPKAKNVRSVSVLA